MERDRALGVVIYLDLVQRHVAYGIPYICGAVGYLIDADMYWC